MSDVNIWGGTGSGGSGITLPVAINQGGTGAIDAPTARANLSLYSSAEITTLLNLKADITSAHGSLVVPAGTTAERDGTPQEGWIRRNKTLGLWEGYDGTSWVPLGTGSGGSSSGGAVNGTFYESLQSMTADYTVPVGSNSMCAGPLTIPNGVTLLVSTDSVLTVV